MVFSEVSCPPQSGVNDGLVRDDPVDELFVALLFRPRAPIDCRIFEDQVSKSRWIGAVASFGMCRGRLLFQSISHSSCCRLQYKKMEFFFGCFEPLSPPAPAYLPTQLSSS